MIHSLSIHGFKSIERLEELRLGNLNVLIGANGSGKSNLIEAMRMMRAVATDSLHTFLQDAGLRAEGYFFNGQASDVRLTLASSFHPTVANVSTHYKFGLDADGQLKISSRIAGGGAIFDKTSELDPYFADEQPGQILVFANKFVADWQFLSTNRLGLKLLLNRFGGVNQFDRLRHDASNLSPMLYQLKQTEPGLLESIEEAFRQVVPDFVEFGFAVQKHPIEDEVRFTWRKRGTDYLFVPAHLSDGSLRYLALVTMLLHETSSTTLIIDEPELGLHPQAIAYLGGLFRSASASRQIILATQSPLLVSEFDPESIVTVDLIEGKSHFRRLDPQSLADWLTDYSLGDLWVKGHLGAEISHA
jgi:predicted ATPase